MIQQKAKGLNSRSEAIPYLEDGFLPLITAPMYSVVNETNYQIFLDNKVRVCLPRNIGISLDVPLNKLDSIYEQVWCSVSLQEFVDYWCRLDSPAAMMKFDGIPDLICIDTANGNMPQLHEAIREAKKIHGDNLKIMAGNVSSVEAFVELAKTGVDYIRVGIGGGSGCNTTNNTGVGQEDLGILIHHCNYLRNEFSNPVFKEGLHNYPFFGKFKRTDYTQLELANIHNVKIVADGISSYIKLCQQKYNFNDNGYAAIIKLLNSGADLVMIGGLFAQCVESAGDKRIVYSSATEERISNSSAAKLLKESSNYHSIEVKISGMSTVEEQKKYKEPTNLGTQDLSVPKLKPSEGSTKWVPVRWMLKEWLQGSDKQDEYPYLNGFVNSLKSAMSYTGSRTLNEFKL